MSALLAGVVFVRCTAEEAKQWGERAARLGRSLSWWVRHAAQYVNEQNIDDPRQLSLPFDSSTRDATVVGRVTAALAAGMTKRKASASERKRGKRPASKRKPRKGKR